MPFPLLTLWLACQDPFPVDRHDLVGFRVAAIEVDPVDPDAPEGPWRPRIAAVVDGRPWADRQPLLDWFWLADADQLADLDALSNPDAVGPAPELDLDPERPVLGLLARVGDQEQRSFVVLDADARSDGASGEVPERIRTRSVDLPVDGLTEETSTLDARRALRPGEEVAAVASGQAVRIDAVGVPPDGRIRWMATAGTFLELDGATTDWLASDLTLDDGEVETREDLLDQSVTVIGLSTGQGRVHFAASDHVVTEANLAPHIRLSGRLLFGPPVTEPSFAQLVADDAYPSGLVMVSAEPVQPPPRDLDDLAEIDAGTAGLGCFEPVDGPFEIDWLLELRCPRSAFDGAIVLVVPDEWRQDLAAR